MANKTARLRQIRFVGPRANASRPRGNEVRQLQLRRTDPMQQHDTRLGLGRLRLSDPKSQLKGRALLQGADGVLEVAHDDMTCSCVVALRGPFVMPQT